MTTESLVAGFLETKSAKDYCDWCIATRLRSQEGVHVKHLEVSRAAITLAESGAFCRLPGRCSLCKEPGYVTRSR